MTLAWVAEQIRSMKAEQPGLIRFNPKPPGAIQEGSATDLVLRLLAQHPGRWWTSEQIIAATGRTHAAISFALLYLRDQQLITCVTDESRNSRYLRYRYLIKG